MVCAMHRLFETPAQSVKDDRVMEGDLPLEEEPTVRQEDKKLAPESSWMARLRGVLSLKTES